MTSNHTYKATCKEHEQWKFFSNDENKVFFHAGFHCGEYVCPESNIGIELIWLGI